MRKKDLEKLLLCLTEEERENVKTALKTHNKGKSLTQIFVTILDAGQIDSKKLAAKYNTSTRTISRTLNELENIVIVSVGSSPAEPTMEMHIKAALELTLRMHFEPAIAIIRRVFAKAKAIEEFNTIFVLYELSEMIFTPFDLGQPTLDEVVALQYNLWTYEQLKVRMKAVLKAELSAEDAKERLSEIIQHPLMDDETSAISFRAKATYNWLLLRYYFHLGEMANGLPVQKRLIEILNENEWLRVDKDFFLIKENEVLAGLYFKNDQDSKGFETIFQTGIQPTEKTLVEVNKLSQLFPLKTGIAMRKGDMENGLRSIAEFDVQFERLKGHFSPNFIYRNQYFNAYFYFASASYEKASLILVQYFSKCKTEIPPLFWPMAKVLEIFNMYSQGESDTAIRLVKNIRMSSHYDESPFFLIATGLVSRLCNYLKPDHPKILRKFYFESKSLENDAISFRFFQYFDISAWIRSEFRQTIMLNELADSTFKSSPTAKNKTGKIVN
jgi:DNA-binding HxlR family transcriptional regulator